MFFKIDSHHKQNGETKNETNRGLIVVELKKKLFKNAGIRHQNQLHTMEHAHSMT